jgi:hypothetical protein
MKRRRKHEAPEERDQMPPVSLETLIVRRSKR